MKIRLTGLPSDVGQAVTLIRNAKIFDVVQLDGPYPNRGSRLVRIYIEAQLHPHNGAVP